MKFLLLALLIVSCSTKQKQDVYPKYVFNKCTGKWAVIIDHTKENGDIYLNDLPSWKIDDGFIIDARPHSWGIYEYALRQDATGKIFEQVAERIGFERSFVSKQAAILAWDGIVKRIQKEDSIIIVEARQRRTDDSIFKCQHTYE